MDGCTRPVAPLVAIIYELMIFMVQGAYLRCCASRLGVSWLICPADWGETGDERCAMPVRE